MPHDLAFHRDMNLYVDYSADSGGWIAPASTECGYDFGTDRALDDKRADTREHLAAFQALATSDAFSREAMLALHRVWKASYVTAKTAKSDVDRLRVTTDAQVATVTSCTPGTIRESPLCLWPCYSFLVNPTPV